MNNLNPFQTSAVRPHAGCFLALFMMFLAGGATALAQVVTNSADSGPGTLRSAITNAASGAVITFDPSLSGATITLSNTLTINTNLTIDASALPSGLQINGNGSVQIFNVASNMTVFLNSLTITNGFASGGSGGGIGNDGTLTLNQCTLSGNSAHENGGFEGGLGGGIYNYAGTLTLNQCILSGNNAALQGGGIYIFIGTATLNQCTLSGNNAEEGGGIYNDAGTMTLIQCTLSGNSATFLGGGGIYNLGALTLIQCTLSGNSGNYDFNGAGILNHSDGTLALTNTIVGGNNDTNPFYADDIYNYFATLTYGGSNLVQSVNNSGGTITGPAPLTNAPDLAPLGNYGGPTQTMPPLPGSPAIGAGSVAANTFSTDQRGYSRTQNGLIDLGAVEVQSPTSITKLANGDILIQFSGGYPGILYDVEESSNLLTWTVAATDPANAMGSFAFEDTNTAGVPVQFYRTALAFTVGGTLTGLPAGDTVTLQDNGSDNLTLSNNGTFTFPTALPNGHTYSVTGSGTGGGTLTTYTTHTATANGSGTISGTNVTNVVVRDTGPVLTGDKDLDMLNAAVADGTAHGGVPGVMYTENGGPFRVTAPGTYSYDVSLRYYPWSQLAVTVGNTSCSSTTFPSGTPVIQFGTALACGQIFDYGY